MTRMALRGWCMVALLGLVVAAGCPKPTSDRPATSPVTGTVTLGGQPVEGAIVTFISTGGGESAVGTTDAAGKYALTTFESGDGAVPGEYAVKIVKYEASAPAADSGIVESDGGAFIPNNPNDTGVQANLLPEKYSNPGTSGLTATVGQEPSTADFTLEQ